MAYFAASVELSGVDLHRTAPLLAIKRLVGSYFWNTIGEHEQKERERERERDAGLSLPLIDKSTRCVDDEDDAHLMVQAGLFSFGQSSPASEDKCS